MLTSLWNIIFTRQEHLNILIIVKHQLRLETEVRGERVRDSISLRISEGGNWVRNSENKPEASCKHPAVCPN